MIGVLDCPYCGRDQRTHAPLPADGGAVIGTRAQFLLADLLAGLVFAAMAAVAVAQCAFLPMWPAAGMLPGSKDVHVGRIP